MSTMKEQDAQAPAVPDAQAPEAEPERAPTLEDVARLEAELERTRADAEEAGREAAEAKARARRNPRDAEAIRSQVEAEARCAAFAGRAEDLEAEIERTRAAALVAEARRRLVGIHRAHASLSNEYEEDAQRVRRAADAFVEAIRRINERHGDLLRLEAEAAALVARFDLDPPPLTPALAPADVPAALAAKLRANAEALAERPGRRIRVPIDGTPGARLIEQAGPGPEEARAEADREAERERERASVARAAGWLEAEIARARHPVFGAG